MTEFLYGTDGYKLDHRRQYPEGTTHVCSNLTARTSRIPEVTKAVFFGLRGYLAKYLMENADQTFFSYNKRYILDEYKEFLDNYFGPNDITVEHIGALHDLGYIPLKFYAIPEGTEVPLRIPMFTFENTHPDFFWLTNYIETGMSSVLWPAIQSATTALHYRQLLDEYCETTGGDPSFVDYQAHDFSFRGLMGMEAPELVGAAHLQYFKGTDSLPAVRFMKKYYGKQVGVSVPATEHSVMCAGGQVDEIHTFERLLRLYPKGVFSVVSDTWDLWYVVDKILPKLKPEIMARDGKLVIRPDSGDPVKIICGDEKAPKDSLAFKGLIEVLWGIFGGTVNSKGYKELDSHIGTIYGDSITPARCDSICNLLKSKGFVSTSVVFGIGSYTYQYVTRDILGLAIKATWARINGKEHMLYKDPKTDDGTKRSAKGRIVVLRNTEGELYMLDNLLHEEWQQYQNLNQLRPVWENGKFI